MNEPDIMTRVKRERKTEQEVRAKDACDIVECIHGLEDEIEALEEKVRSWELAYNRYNHDQAHDFAERNDAPLGNHVWNFILAWALKQESALQEPERERTP